MHKSAASLPPFTAAFSTVPCSTAINNCPWLAIVSASTGYNLQHTLVLPSGIVAASTFKTAQGFHVKVIMRIPYRFGHLACVSESRCIKASTVI